MQSLEFFQNLEKKLFENLRCYQKEGIQKILNYIENGEKSILRQNFTGTGKSVEQNYLAIKHLSENPENIVLFLTHKEELVQNLAEYFLKEKIYLSYIQAGKATLYNSRIFIASVDTLRNRLEKVKIKPSLILIEECFPSGTLVDGKPIENYKIGDFVWSWDEKTGDIAKKKITHIFKNKSSDFVKIKFSNGLEITSTLAHPFYVKNRGWINACEISKNDELYILPESCGNDKIQNESMVRDEKSILFQGLFNKTQKNFTRVSGKPNLPSVQKTCKFDENSNGKLQKFWTSLLFFSLFKIDFSNIKFFNNGGNKRKICESKNETEQSDEKRRSERKSKQYFEIYESSTSNKGGKWKTRTNTAKNIIRFIKQFIELCLENGIYSTDRIKRLWLSNTLQNRYSQRSINDCNRSGRDFTSSFKKETIRSEKNQFFEVIRVESVKIYKSTSFRKSSECFRDGETVYNLEIEDYHTYFANGVLVHNCHHGLAKTWRKILDYYQDSIKVGFSATLERLDGASFNQIFNVMVTGKLYTWYVDNNFLAPYQLIRPKNLLNVELKKVGGDFDLLQQEEVLDKDVIYSDAIETWEKHTPGLKTVTFCTSIKHSQKVADAYNNYSRGEYGKDIAIHLDGKTNKNLRKDAIARFRLPPDHPESLLVICNLNLISEGVNIPDCQVTQWLRKTASEIFYDQGNGRSNRYQPGKIQYIIDHVGNWLLHGYPDRIRNYDLVGRKEKEKEAKYHLKCENCGTIVHKDYRKLQGFAEWIDCLNCGCSVVVPVKKSRQNQKRREKQTDFDAEMILDNGENSHIVNLHALFRKYDYLNNHKFFDTLIKFDSIKLDELKIACKYRNIPEYNAYSAWSRKIHNILKV